MQSICVVGLGYVGLPTACAFARSGFLTIGVDTKQDVVEAVNRGESYLPEQGIAEAVREEVGNGKLSATTDLKGAVSGSDAVIIAVQTPFEGGRANLDYLRSACEQVAASVRDGGVVIVESTVPPGTCKKVLLPIFGRLGKQEGSGFYFAYCPERIAPGYSLEEFMKNDRIVGTSNEKSRGKAFELMKSVAKGSLLATDILTAETTKLVENAARDVYIAFANDLAKISGRIGVDVKEVIALANTHPRVKILNPGPGVGGPCLPKDPYLLLEGLEGSGPDQGVMIKAARSVNGSMPEEVLALANADGGLKSGSKVAVLGTSYKPEVGDPRSSPSEPIIHSLLERGCQVVAFDPYCREAFGAKMAKSLTAATSGADCALLLVAHSAFRDLDFGKLASTMAPDPLIVDAAGISRPEDANSVAYRLRRLGDGKNLPPGKGR